MSIYGDTYLIDPKRMEAFLRASNQWTGTNRFANGSLSIVPSGGSVVSGPFGTLVTTTTTNNSYSFPDQSGIVALVSSNATDPTLALFATSDAGIGEFRAIEATDISDGLTDTFTVDGVELVFTNGVLTARN